MNKYSMQDIKDLIALTLEGDPVPDYWLENRLEVQREHSNGSKHLYYRLFYHIAKQLQPEFTVELGGWRGLASGFFAGGNPNGIVVSIDHHGDPGDDAHKAEMLKVTHQFENMQYIQGWTWDVFPQVEKFNKQIDCLFIDGWHMYDKAMRDWETYSPLLANNALVICDDLLRGNSATIAGMIKFWDEISNGFDKHIEDSEIHAGFPMGFFKYEY